MSETSLRSPVEVPARIHLLPAMHAPVVIVIRRKPSDVFYVMRWNTETGELRGGSWFRGRLYELRSDVSFDGKYMVYLAMGSRGESWNGICQPPFLRTDLDWPNVGTWHGGGVFTSPQKLEANPGHSFGDMRTALESLAKTEKQNRTGKTFPFEIGILPQNGYSEDEGVLFPRLVRDGFVRLGDLPNEKVSSKGRFTVTYEDDPGWERRPSKAHPALRLRYRGYNLRLNRPSRVFEFDLPEHPGLLDPNVDWANFDALGQLIFARGGRVYLYRREDIGRGTPSQEIDLEEFAPPERNPNVERRIPGAEPEPEPRPEIVSGAVEAQAAQVLVLPRNHTAWVRQIYDLIGGNLATDLAVADFNPVAVTSAYYLRQHAIVHVQEPVPDKGIEALRSVVEAAFDAAGGRAIALRPIGIDAGWPVEIAFHVSYEAALRRVRSEHRQIIVVAEDEQQEEMFRALAASFDS